MNNYIYVDNSSTTKLDRQVLEKMMPFFTDYYGNASTLYELGRISKKAIEEARNTIAKLLNVLPEEIYFTGSGTEADNISILGIARGNKEKGKHIITTNIEHLAVLNSCKELENEGYDVTYVGVEENGIVNPQKIKEAIREDTTLISVMYVNNEIGTIQNVDEISKIAKENNIIFHTDAVQAASHIKLDASKFDAMSLSGHKFNGPKGIGILYAKKGIKIQNIRFGGHQECGLIPATENVAAIVGISEALKKTSYNLNRYNEKEKELRNYLLSKLKTIDGFHLNGSEENRINNNINFCIDGIDSNELALFFEMNGIYVSTGSACNSGIKDISHVLKAIGKDTSGIRVTLSHENTFNQMDKIYQVIVKSIQIMSKK